MIAVIIAGGSGSRLWPLSTPDYPKHLLKVNGGDRSLLQSTYDRVKKMTDTVYIASEASHIHHVKEQLPELTDEQFIVEPARRGTAHALIAALQYISQRHDPSEPIASLHADHYVRDTDGFLHSFRVANDISTKEGRIVLVGVEPTGPAINFGYIKKAGLIDDTSFVFNVDSFKEKPDHKTAQSYVRSGKYLWNCGYFVGSIDTFKSAMEQYSPELLQSLMALESTTSPAAFEKTYLALDTQTIDVALIEKVRDLLVVPASFDWMDLGSFSDLSKAVETDESGNYSNGFVELEEVENTYVQNLEDKPVAVIGLSNAVVVNTPQGIIVTRKDLSQRVGDVSKRFQAR